MLGKSWGPVPFCLTLLLLLQVSSLQVYAQTFNVRIVSYNAPLTVPPETTVSVQLTVEYNFPSASYMGIVISRRLPDGSWVKVWESSDHVAGQGVLTYSAAFMVPSQPGTYEYAIGAWYWDGNRWVSTDEKYFTIEVSSPYIATVTETVTSFIVETRTITIERVITETRTMEYISTVYIPVYIPKPIVETTTITIERTSTTTIIAHPPETALFITLSIAAIAIAIAVLIISLTSLKREKRKTR
jgi:hypothetical protein